MKHFYIAIFASALSSVASYANAGCANYTDGSMGNTPAPKYLVCYDNACDITEATYQCANTSSYQAGYAVGWDIDCKLNDDETESCTFSWQGRPIDPSKFDRLRIEEITD